MYLYSCALLLGAEVAAAWARPPEGPGAPLLDPAQARVPRALRPAGNARAAQGRPAASRLGSADAPSLSTRRRDRPLGPRRDRGRERARAGPSRSSPTATRRSCAWSSRRRSADRASRTARSTSTRSSTSPRSRCAAPGPARISSRSPPPAPTSARGSTSTTSTSRATRSSPAAATSSGRAGSTKGTKPTAYAHVATEKGRLALQYWFFYPFNDFNNTHEGDWEMIQLNFDAPDAQQALETQPTEVGYSPARGGRALGLGRREAEQGRRDAPGRLRG